MARRSSIPRWPILLGLCEIGRTMAFSNQGQLVVHRHRLPSPPLQTRCPLSLSSTYGRGAEIWPECNESPIQLKDSFPNGILPSQAEELLRNGEEPPLETPVVVVGTKKGRRRLPRAIQNILSRAAVRSQKWSSFEIENVDMTPAVIAAALLVGGLVRPVDVLMVAFFSGYLMILGQLAKSTRADGISPLLPSLPPQGHVPALVSNPLGNTFTKSQVYDMWLKAGTFLSLLAPIFMLWRYTFFGNRPLDAAKACARPVFLLCCQAWSEGISRKLMAPLPIRILVPVAYNTLRLGTLWSWALSSTPLGKLGRILAVVNLLYWAANLFGFLLPTATIRYMRAHFFCVEAEQVTIRPGWESTIGLMP